MNQPYLNVDPVLGLWGTPGRHQKACRRLPRGRLDQCPLSPGQSGKLSRELDFVSHHVRTKLDELKRQEVSRLRMLLKAKMDAQQEPSERGAVGGADEAGAGPVGQRAPPGFYRFYRFFTGFSDL